MRSRSYDGVLFVLCVYTCLLSQPGPYIVNGRYETEVPREFRHAGDLLRSEGMLQVSLGKHVRQAFENGWKVQEGPGCWSPGFAAFIGGFLAGVRRW